MYMHMHMTRKLLAKAEKDPTEFWKSISPNWEAAPKAWQSITSTFFFKKN